MAFEYKRVEAFNRGIGALLNRIAAALDDLEAIAGEPEFATVQVRAAGYVHALGAMKKTLTRKLQLVNRLQAQAAKAMSRRSSAAPSTTPTGSGCRIRPSGRCKSFESLHERMARLRSELAAAKPLTLPMAETGEEDANKIAGAAPAATLGRLRRELARLDDAIVIESTSKAFAVQFSKERPKLEQQFERMASVSSYLRATAREITGDQGPAAPLAAGLKAAGRLAPGSDDPGEPTLLPLCRRWRSNTIAMARTRNQPADVTCMAPASSATSPDAAMSRRVSSSGAK